MKYNEIVDIMIFTIKEIEKEIAYKYERYRDRFNLSDQEAIENLSKNYTSEEIKMYADNKDYAHADATSAKNGLNMLLDRRNTIIDFLKDNNIDIEVDKSEGIKVIEGIIKVKPLEYSLGGMDIANTKFKVGFLVKFGLSEKTINNIFDYDLWLKNNISWYKNIDFKNQEEIIIKYCIENLLRGKGINELTSKLKKNTTLDDRACEIIASTEISCFLNISSLKSLKRDGDIKYEVISALDHRTCKNCGNLDCKIFNIDEAIIGVNVPPFHEGCRCCVLPYINEKFNRRYKIYTEKDKEAYLKIQELKKKDYKDLKTKDKKLIEKEGCLGQMTSGKHMTWKQWNKKYNILK